MARIIVTGYMVRLPFMGNLLAFAPYVTGLQRLGHTVHYGEESGWDNACYNPQTRVSDDDPSYGMQAVEGLFAVLGSPSTPVIYVNRSRGTVFGTTYSDLIQCLRQADLLLNIGGVCWLDCFSECRRRALIDMDPMFTQAGKFGQEGMDSYDTLFTYGTNVGQADSTVPTLGRAWMPTVPPVLNELWQNSHSPNILKSGFTTVANWSAYGNVTYGGEIYGQKDVEFERLIHLPRHVPCPLTIKASGISMVTANRFRSAGWNIEPPDDINSDLDAYRDFIISSAGEFSPAKGGYIKSRCGWISDRTVCYLAAGRPVVIADTGDRTFNQCDSGVSTFQTLEEAASAVCRTVDAYEEHVSSAREIARTRFDSGLVLDQLLTRALN